MSIRRRLHPLGSRLSPEHPKFVKHLGGLTIAMGLLFFILSEITKGALRDLAHIASIISLEIGFLAFLFEMMLVWAWEEGERRRTIFELYEGRRYIITEMYMIFKLNPYGKAQVLEYTEYLKYKPIAESSHEEEHLVEPIYYDVAYALGKGTIIQEEDLKVEDQGEYFIIHTNGKSYRLNRVELEEIEKTCKTFNPWEGSCKGSELSRNCELIPNGLSCRVVLDAAKPGEGEIILRVKRRYLYPYDLTGKKNNLETVKFSRIIQRPTEKIVMIFDESLGKQVKFIEIYSFNETSITKRFQKCELKERRAKKNGREHKFKICEIKPDPRLRNRFFILERIRVVFNYKPE